jgi:hypothetical protein
MVVQNRMKMVTPIDGGEKKGNDAGPSYEKGTMGVGHSGELECSPEASGEGDLVVVASVVVGFVWNQP